MIVIINIIITIYHHHNSLIDSLYCLASISSSYSFLNYVFSIDSLVYNVPIICLLVSNFPVVFLLVKKMDPL